MAEQTVTLQPGESKLVSFEAIPHEVKTYRVVVDGLEGSFNAVAEEPTWADFGGVVSDAETKLPLSGVIVQMWTKDGNELVAWATTDSAGFYQITNILVPVTVVFSYQKSGYTETITDPIYLDPSGGGLNIELVPLAPTQLVMYYTNPHSATHWDVYDLMSERRLSEGELAKRIDESYVFVPENETMLLLSFREAINVFSDIREYGPYAIPISGLGEYIWDAGAERMNGVSATKLMDTSCNITCTVLSYTETNVPRRYMLTIQVEEASGTPGTYFLGKQIKVEAGEYSNRMVGEKITGSLKMLSYSPGQMMYYPGYVWSFYNLTYVTGYPDWAFNFTGDLVTFEFPYLEYEDNRPMIGKGLRWRVESAAGLDTFKIAVMLWYEVDVLDGYLIWQGYGPASGAKAALISAWSPAPSANWRRFPYLAFVAGSGMSAAALRQARILKARYGNLLQLADGAGDQAEINAALAAVAGRVTLSEGQFSLGSPILPLASTVLEGQGYGTQIVCGTADIYMANVNNVGYVQIRKIRFTGQDREDGNYHIWVQGANGVRVKIIDCDFETKISSILLDSDTDYCEVIGCRFYDIGDLAGAAGYGILAARSNHNLIQGNYFEDVHRHCIYLSTTASYNRVVANHCMGSLVSAITSYSLTLQVPGLHNVIIGNIIEDSEIGIDINCRSAYHVVSDNIIENSTAAGIRIMGQGDLAEIDTPRWITIKGNIIEGKGILVQNGNWVNIVDNIINLGNPANWGITLTYAGPPTAPSNYTKHCRVTGNIINGPGAIGIRHDAFSQCNHNYLADNTFNQIVTPVSMVSGAVAPTAGRWQKGEKFWQQVPSAGATPGWVCVNQVDTTVRIDTVGAYPQVTVEVVATAGMLAGDYIGVVIDDGSIHWTTIAVVNDADTLTLTVGVPSIASATNEVYTYRWKAMAILAA